jgi:hypothetical protein
LIENIRIDYIACEDPYQLWYQNNDSTVDEKWFEKTYPHDSYIDCFCTSWRSDKECTKEHEEFEIKQIMDGKMIILGIFDKEDAVKYVKENFMKYNSPDYRIRRDRADWVRHDYRNKEEEKLKDKRFIIEMIHDRI